MEGRAASPAIAARCVCHNVPRRMPAGEVLTTWFTLENTGSRTWQAPEHKVSLLLDGNPIITVELPHAVPPGARVTLYGVFRVTGTAGPHEIAARLTGDTVTDADGSSTALCAAVELVDRPPTRTARLRDRVLGTYARCWLPCDGMSWSRDSAVYPNFAQDAHGCRIRDVEGREFVDYLMGWGSALLGYANERILAAIAETLHSTLR